MLRSIQWKLVTISFLLVWLAMSIVGSYATEAIKQEQLKNMTDTIVSRGNFLANTLKDKMVGGTNVEDILQSWHFGQGQQVKYASVYQKDIGFMASTGTSGYTSEGVSEDNSDAERAYVVGRVFAEKKEKVFNGGSKYSRGIGIPIYSSDNELVGAIYIDADLSSVESNIDRIKGILTTVTVWVLCITVLLGSLLARTITGPIKEVTSKAAKLAKGDFGQIIAVKSNDEVGKLTETFNYLTVRLKSTLDEIQQEKNKVETVITHMTDGIIAVNRDGGIMHINPAVYKLLDISEEAIGDKSFDEISQLADMGMTTEDLFNGSDGNHEIMMVNDSIIKHSVVLFKNERGETAGAIVVLQDVTEQERLDKMRKEFVANVSHELRTPLTTIKSYTETLLDGAVENREYTVNFLNVINSESERMTRLVKDLLELSKMDFEKAHWSMKPVSIYDITKECVFRMDISAKQKNHELIFQSEDGIPEINGDKDRVEQVIVNIISNAIKYTPDNGKITVKLAKDAGSVILRISDTGLGIPKEDLPRLFERFYRVDKARSRMLGGTGLGLAIAKQIVEAHGGTIRIESEYGKGTEVIITFPGIS